MVLDKGIYILALECCEAPFFGSTEELFFFSDYENLAYLVDKYCSGSDNA